MTLQNFDLPLYDIAYDDTHLSLFLHSARGIDFSDQPEDKSGAARQIVQAFINSRPQPLGSRNLDSVDDTHSYLMGESPTQRRYDTARGMMDRILYVVKLGSEALRSARNNEADKAQSAAEKDRLAEAEPTAIRALDDTIMELFTKGSIDEQTTKSLMVLLRTRASSVEYDVAVENAIRPAVLRFFQMLQDAHAHQVIPRSKGKVNLPMYEDLTVDEGMTILSALKEMIKVPKQTARHPLHTYFELHISNGLSIKRKSLERAHMLSQIDHTIKTGWLD